MDLTIGQWAALALCALYVAWGIPKLVATDAVAHSERFHWSRSGYALDDTRRRMESLARVALVIVLPLLLFAVTAMTSAAQTVHSAEQERTAVVQALIR